jgi:hypothetical protein
MLSKSPGSTGRKVPSIPRTNKIRQRILIKVVSILLNYQCKIGKKKIRRSLFNIWDEN